MTGLTRVTEMALPVICAQCGAVRDSRLHRSCDWCLTTLPPIQHYPPHHKFVPPSIASTAQASDIVTRLEKYNGKLYRVTVTRVETEVSREEVMPIENVQYELAEHFGGTGFHEHSYARSSAAATIAWLFERGYLSDKIVKGGV